MKSTGVVRSLDQLGRIVIPKEIRDSRGWHPGTEIEICINDFDLILKEYHDYFCPVCGACINEDYSFCPNCGVEQKSKEERK